MLVQVLLRPTQIRPPKCSVQTLHLGGNKTWRE